MAADKVLDTADHVAAIATAGLAAWAWAYYHLQRFLARIRLERYLREIADFQFGSGEEGAQSLPRLMAELGLSEKDIMDASSRSKTIQRLNLSDPQTGHATTVLLRHKRPEDGLAGLRPRPLRRWRA